MANNQLSNVAGLYKFLRPHHKKLFNEKCQELTGQGCGYKEEDSLSKTEKEALVLQQTGKVLKYVSQSTSSIGWELTKYFKKRSCGRAVWLVHFSFGGNAHVEFPMCWPYIFWSTDQISWREYIAPPLIALSPSTSLTNDASTMLVHFEPLWADERWGGTMGCN